MDKVRYIKTGETFEGGCAFFALNIKNNVVVDFRSVAQLIDALRYKSEGIGFNSRWAHQYFLLS
jgi:hypothetical protein